MSEEIELIMYKLEQNYKCDKEQYFVLYKPDEKQILDYIYSLKSRFDSLMEAHKIADEINSSLESKRDKAIELLDELQGKIMSILNTGIPIKEITDIKEVLRGDKNE